jgi:glycosyltransferase involved in cell wall biosynthesis
MMQQMINSKKICFISCVNDEKAYEKSRAYIERLKVPEDFQVEILPMRQNKSITSAYNRAMHLTDAKYKVYLHQDVYIIHKNFILDIVRIFQENPAIGIAGMVGAKYLSSDGIWWNSQVLLGSIYDNHFQKMREYRYQGNEAAYKEAAALDGLLLATQYDIPWREDVFSGWHFYDISQGMEFQRRKYKVAVLGQKTPWCIHACGMKTIYNYHIERAKFLTEYKNDIKPFVSIMIPTYNRPEYFKIALESAREQIYENIEIIVCDNSTDERTAALMEMYADDSRICYFRNRQARTKSENFQPFEQKAHGEFLQWLMDDDVLEPDKIVRMVQCFLDNPNITLATSNRRWIDERGREIEAPFKFNFGDNVDCAVVSGKQLGKKMLLNIANCIGEPSAVLFRRCDLGNHYWKAECRGYLRISDVAMWLELLQKGDCIYFQLPLSSYRRHGEQEGQQLDVVVQSRLEWIRLLQESYAVGYFIESNEEYKQALNHLLQDAKECILPAIKMLKTDKLVVEYEENIQSIETYLSSCN